MKSPSWHRDEIILALDLYRTLDSKDMTKNHPKVIELSELLNELPIHERNMQNEKFRNTNGVQLKLSNFKYIDPDFAGKGMSGCSNQDKEVFFEFMGKDEELHAIASQIKLVISNRDTNCKLKKIEDEEDYSAKEGKVIYKLHKLRERDRKINNKKKIQYFEKYGKLDCEVCGFDFQKFYGDLGSGFIEAHHRVPLSELNGEKTTKLNDLALVCSNCHKMLHRSISIDELKKQVK